jgi:UDP-N-acetylglucosamine--N-acetylmuramyl-(pentapeptide) pyrophosphoryl-undecaprenol N-acetylglucosamine transferase
MTFLIAAAGTGGHVFPGLAVGEALLELGVERDDVTYVGGDRLEARVYPEHGFRFLSVDVAGLKRSVTVDNLRLAGVVRRARRRIVEQIDSLGIEVVLGMGGYVTIPAAMAARARRKPFFNAEQNAEAGLANKVTARWARASFVSFPRTGGLPRGTWVGNPVRRPIRQFDRERLRPGARLRYGVEGHEHVLGVFGGSLGAGVLNEAVATMVEGWDGPRIGVVHLTGETHLADLMARQASEAVTWSRIGFETEMEWFYAAADLVIARAGGAVAELTVTATPSILVPGRFGSGGHQEGNARFLAASGAAFVVEEAGIAGLPEAVTGLFLEPARLADMASAASDIAKPEAALTIARTMIEAAG